MVKPPPREAKVEDQMTVELIDKVAQIKSLIDYPITDVDGHYLEFLTPPERSLVQRLSGGEYVDRLTVTPPALRYERMMLAAIPIADPRRCRFAQSS
jgi:hypothetical protein